MRLLRVAMLQPLRPLSLRRQTRWCFAGASAQPLGVGGLTALLALGLGTQASADTPRTDPLVPFEGTDVRLNLARPAEGDRQPRIVRRIDPYYPPEYGQARVEGDVVIEFIVTADGRVVKPSVVRAADPRLANIALQAIVQWQFYPGMKNGRAVNTRMQQPFSFRADMASGTPPPAEDPGAAVFAQHQRDGQTALAAQAYEPARAAFTAAIRSAPDNADGYLGRARAFVGLGHADDALADFSQAAALNPSYQQELDAYQASLPNTPERTWANLRHQTFQTVWRTVYETYYDPTFGGVDWRAVRERYHARLTEAGDRDQLLRLLQQMLGELRRSHFSILPRETAVFTPAERVRIGTTGTEVAFVEDGVAIIEVRTGLPGAVAGLRPGDQILKVDDSDLRTGWELLGKSDLTPARRKLYLSQFVESRLNGAVGTTVRLEVQGATDPAPRVVPVTCVDNDAAWSEPIGYFPSSPIRCSAVRGTDGVAVLQFNLFVPPVMKQIRAFLRQLQPGDGLIVDLRGNSGGISVMASGLCGWLCREEFVLGAMHQRDGQFELSVYPQKHVFDGPIAILIDGRSASTTEILAAGLKERGRARLFGEPSAGAALPSLFRNLPTGDLFQFAVADLTTPSGALLEGTGVTPDVTLPRRREDLVAGRDAVMEAARAWIETERRLPSPALAQRSPR